ncbi:MFS transporter [Fodinicola feengrottensis]|uniref:MFS transporter n=2 Tax=Fodinicola feengrottensis TaxID=435914 RepID=A0ABN2FQL3_9ACTN
MASVHLAVLVSSISRGAWFTCWALFFLHGIGLSTAQFGIGVTAAGIAGLAISGPLGYLADRIGTRETLLAIGIAQCAAMFAFAVVRDFPTILAVTCVLVAAERATPGMRVALVSGLAEPDQRLSSVSTAHAMVQLGTIGGAVVGTVVLSVDTDAAYRTLCLGCGTITLVFLALLARVPHVTSLSDLRVKRRMLVLRDRPFLLLTAFNGVLALNWGMLDAGVPLWITTHTRAPVWTMGVLIGLNSVIMALFITKVTKAGTTIAGAARLANRAGIALSVSCVIFAASNHTSGGTVVAILLVAAAVHVVGELCFVGSGLGLSVGLTPADAHGEYQGMFGTGQAVALMIAPGLMTILLTQLGIAGWLILAAVYLLSGAGTLFVARKFIAAASDDD